MVQAASGSLMEVGREKGPSEGRATRKPHPQSHRGGKKTEATACGDTSAPKRHRPQEGAIFLEQCSARSCCSKC